MKVPEKRNSESMRRRSLLAFAADVVLAVSALILLGTFALNLFQGTIGLMAALEGLGFGALCLGLRLTDVAKKRMALVLVVLALPLYFCEVWLTVQGIDGYARLDALRRGLPIDPRTRWEASRDFAEAGLDVLPADPGTVFISMGLDALEPSPFPLTSLSHSRVLTNLESEQWHPIQTDGFGFHNPPGLHQGPADVVLLGDSFAFGCGVRQGEDVGGRLRERFEGSVVNLGAMAHGPLRELAILKEFGEPLKPKRVFWLYCGANDLRNLGLEMEVSILREYFVPEFEQGLRGRQAEVDRFYRGLTAGVSRAGGGLAELKRCVELTSSRRVVQISLQARKEPDLQAFRRILKEAKSRVHAWEGQLSFVFVPSSHQYGSEIAALDSPRRPEVLAIVNELGIPLIDLHQVFSKEEEPLSNYGLGGLHLNAQGNQVLAEEILGHLKESAPSLDLHGPSF